ncbi:tetratricopeptide repeat protein [Fluviispira vulneris]|uniref:tetratricopeptide repeat protein n=1 Tax=Fluviispira vulneris TaxID=2763012 RepID=UPI0016463A1E|nr:tetratricopeptide repeat protein [Fluviispira vulneris]
MTNQKAELSEQAHSHHNHDNCNHEHHTDHGCKNDQNHEHGKCNHHHEHNHEHGKCSHNHEHNHEHGKCNHNHEHHHEHGKCNHHHDHEGHSHEPKERYNRYSYTDEEIVEFSKNSTDDLIELVNSFLTEEIYGKAVPLLEIIFLRLSSDKNNIDSENIFSTKHHLALAYGIIGEHSKSIPLWKEVIKSLEKEEDTSETLEAYYNAALSAEQAQNEKEYVTFITKGLQIAKDNNFEDWEAAFEHELGIHNMDKSDYGVAEEKFNRALSIRAKIEDEEGIIITQYHLASLYEAKKEIERAKKLYEETLALTKKECIREHVEHERSLIEERLSLINNAQLQSKLLKF